METTTTEATNKKPETAPKANAGAPGTATQKTVTDKETAKALQEAEKLDKELVAKYGKQPSEESILQEFKKTDMFKDCDKYEDVLKIIKEGKDPANKNTDGQSLALYDRLKKNVKKAEETAKTTTDTTSKSRNNRPIEEKMNDKSRVEDPKNKAEINTFLEEYNGTKQKTIEKKSEKPAEKKEKPAEKTSSRWTAEDEAKRPGSKPAVKKEKSEKPAKEKSEKKSGGIFKSIGRGITRPLRNAGKMVKTVGKTLRTPIGLTSYLLADIGEKERSGRKDRWAGYGKIRKGKSAK